MTQDTSTPIGDAADTAPPMGSAPSKADHPRTPLRPTLRQRLSHWDVKVSPYLYVAPFFIVFAIIGLYPMIYSGYLSFFSWPHIGASHGPGVGWANYSSVLHDPIFRKALWNTIGIFLLSSVPQVIIATIIAGLLDTHLRGRTWWRMSVLVPFVVAPAAIALIFGSLFADKYGLINEILTNIGLPKVSWHGNRFASWTAIASMVNYRWTGYNALILLAAMQAVPRDLYEAASIDGASRVKQFLFVTLPSIRPTMLFVIVTSTIGGLQIFTEPSLFDNTNHGYGGADYQFQTLTMYVVNATHKDTNPYPRAAAAAWIVFLIIVAFALVNFLITRAAQRRSRT